MPYLCDACLYGPPSSVGGKPCSFCDFDADNPVFNFYTRKEEPVMTRTDILQTAWECVCGEREQDYGTPENNFARIARLWRAYSGHEYTPVDVAMMMALLKIARIKTGTGTADSFVDLAGYAACAGEIATSGEAASDA